MNEDTLQTVQDWQQRGDEAEDRGIGAGADGQRDEQDDGQAWLAGEGAQSIPDVASQAVHSGARCENRP